MKKCYKCGCIKEINCFHKDKNKSDGCRNLCKQCVSIYYKKHNEKNKQRFKEESRQYYLNNIERLKEKSKNYYYAHKAEISVKKKRYRKENKKKMSEQGRKYYQKNKKKRNKYLKQKYRNNVQYKLALNSRRRLCKIIRRDQKAGSAVQDLGCSVAELKQYLESKFQEGMSWENWSQYGWHIDHIKPLCSFDLTDRKQFLEACHYTNLRPLWAEENLNKRKEDLLCQCLK